MVPESSNKEVISELLDPLTNTISDIIEHKFEYLVSTGLVVNHTVAEQVPLDQGLTVSGVGAVLGGIYMGGRIIKELLIPLIKQIIKWFK